MHIGEFDFIVVGAGSAGCAVAGRLAAQADVRIALIEAGPRDRNPLLHHPLGGVPVLGNRWYDWGYNSQAEAGMNGRVIPHPRGKVLGGSSAINGMIYTRGPAYDFDLWRQMGASGWSYEDVLPYFKRSETAEHLESGLRGTDGPLGTRTLPITQPLNEAFLDAGVSAGYERLNDFNGDQIEGFAYFNHTADPRTGRRNSSAKAYLRKLDHVGHVKIISHCQATGLLFNDGRVTGLKVMQGTAEKTISARHEVILSCGVFNTPQLLQLSGFGPPDVLKAHNIPVRHACPEIGTRLQDHIDVSVSCRTKAGSAMNTQFASIPKLLMGAARSLRSGAGWAGHFPVACGAFVRTAEHLDVPDVQFHFFPALLDREGAKPLKEDGFSTSVCLLRPHSQGHVYIQSADPLAPPEIMFNYLSEAEDLRVLRDGMRMARALHQEPAFAGFDAVEVAPGADVESDADWDAYCRQYATTIYHPVGTCRMGDMESAPVTSQLKVRGVEGLRVADASVMPSLIGANTNAASIMIGERAAVFARAAA